jgi:UDPglucose--hexose-1-phosphate uridylyltransferase
MIQPTKQVPLVAPSDGRGVVRGNPTAESRLDPLTGNWTIFSPQRTGRPDEFVDSDVRADSKLECPFCPGNEEATPDPVWSGRISTEDSGFEISQPGQEISNADWSVRVVPNKFPAVNEIETASPKRVDANLFQRSGIGGGHEVIIESRQHVESLTELDLAELSLVFLAYRDRLQYWRSMSGISYLSVFKNVGGRAGASLSHSHSQLIATNRLPAQIKDSIDLMSRHRAATGCCLMCDLVRGELKSKQRIIWADNALVAFCPFASHLPMQVRVTTQEHEDCFENLDNCQLESISRLVGRVVSWLEKLRPGTAYNYCLHTRPPAMDDTHESFHWWIDIFPRMTQVAGFEWSSQCMINPILPEDSASKLGACARAEDPRYL